MLAPLAKRNVGDEESRNLFAAALEYDLASCRQLTEPEKESAPVPRPPQSMEDATLSALAATAESLAAGLEALDTAASRRLQEKLKQSDRFQRGYGEDYLKSLCSELRRISSLGEQPELLAPTQSEEHSLTEDASRFVLRAAHAFEACFEQIPDARVDSTFVEAVEAIVAATGIRVPTDRSLLAQVLHRDSPAPPSRK